jgi:hypothetical protein
MKDGVGERLENFDWKTEDTIVDDVHQYLR